MAHLRLAALDPGQLLNLVLRLLDRGRRMLAEMLFQGSDMRIQFAGRSVQIDFLQFVQTTFLIQKEVVPYGVFSCLLYTSPSPRDRTRSRMPSSA